MGHSFRYLVIRTVFVAFCLKRISFHEHTAHGAEVSYQFGRYRSSLPWEPHQHDANQVVWDVNDGQGDVTALLLEKALHGLCFLFCHIQSNFQLYSLGQCSQTVVFEPSREKERK